jgi:hypothetical protein
MIRSDGTSLIPYDQVLRTQISVWRSERRMETGNRVTGALETGLRCVHCLRLAETPEWDHVFPRSWYPDTTPPTVQRWTVPSCPECNRKLGQLEKDLLVRLALCVDPQSEATSGLAARALRSLGLDVDELPETEKSHRHRLRARIRSELMPRADIAESPGQIPGLGPPSGQPSEWAIPIPWAGLSIIAEKIARGCEYALMRRYVEPPYGIRTFSKNSAAMPEKFVSFGESLDLGPGCRVMRVFAAEDPNVVSYWILIWRTLCFEVLIDLEAELQKIQCAQPEGLAMPESHAAMAISPYLRVVGR